MFRHAWLCAFATIALWAAGARPAAAIPVFAHRFGLSCQACHTEVPRLTAFGEAFLANGYRIPGVRPAAAFPIAVRLQGAYASAGNGDPGAPLPKAIVDEVELLAGGAAGPRGSYWAEVYAVDGGERGRPRDVWFAQRLGPGSRSVTLRAGQFTLPLPLDPETFRETDAHYAIWDQQIGERDVSLFEPQRGVQAAFGDEARSLAATVSLLQRGTMLSAARRVGDVRVSAYRFDGSGSAAATGAGAVWSSTRAEIAAVYQTSPGANGAFVQARRELGGGTFALARWDVTGGAETSRSVTAGFGHRPTRNTRLTLFGSAKGDGPGGRSFALNASLLAAF